MASSVDESSDYDSGLRSQSDDARAVSSRRGATDTDGTDGEQGEDLFLHIAEDSAARESAAEAASRADRLRSRIARASNRQSFPSANYSSSPAPPSSATPTANGRRIPSTIDTKSSTPARRNSLLPSSSRTQREQTPLTPTYPLDTPRSRLLDLSPKPPVSSSSPKIRDQDLSPRQFLSQLGRRRPSYPDAVQTPPSRAQTYRPSNLYYSSSRDNQDAPHVDHSQGTPSQIPQGTPSRADGTESLDDSTGPAASVWDELDDLKSRIRRIELGGKIPTTSGAVVANATAERPRTANTSVTTVSSSPKQQRKTNVSPPDSTVGTHTVQKAYPVLREALAKTKQYVSPGVFRVLEATASEAIGLAELTGGAGPQGTFHSASSILNGASMPDRQVRRKADNICRSLMELCVALCDTKSSVASPALRTVAAASSRRPSVQINGESPQTIRQSIEPESNTLPRSSPSRAMDRIQARRTSMLSPGLNGSPRESSQDPPPPSQSQIPTRLSRAGTSLHRTHRMVDDDNEDPIMRAPSRAMTDFRDIRSNKTTRFSRDYTSREPMPELQPSPAIQQQTASLRRPTVTGVGNENHMLFRANNNQRYNLDRQSSPAYEKQVSADLAPRSQYNSSRNSIGGASGLGRTASLGRRLRGTAAGE